MGTGVHTVTLQEMELSALQLEETVQAVPALGEMGFNRRRAGAGTPAGAFPDFMIR
ncbi:MAG TPA: hypothetical protein VHN74_13745 [Candidatus Angelobacter sp.]|nr:hypothetical protein [Candidatus Angelobacter sp.]